jgi:hypothetical protein
VRAKGPRIVAVGDLNGAYDALEAILRGTRLTDGRGRWIGGRSELVQVGDIFNRGSGARESFEMLLRLRGEAAAAGGRVVILLGNHEVMVALRNEAYCTEEEYLSFANARERSAWPVRVRRALRRILREHAARGPILPLGPRLDAWKVLNAPGRSALRRALGPSGRLGRAIRNLPIVHRSGDTVFVHAGLMPTWARRGVDGLNQQARLAWDAAGNFYGSHPRRSMFRNPAGPLWNRSLAEGSEGPGALTRSLELLGARRMVIGHTQTAYLGGTPGRILLRHGGRLVCVDVGLRGGDIQKRAALVIQGGAGWEWTEGGTRQLWREGA